MASQRDQGWRDENQRYLAEALSIVRRYVAPDSRAGASAPSSESSEAPGEGRQSQRQAHEMSHPPALETLCQTFGLTEFERAMVLLCAGAELDGSFGAACARAQGDDQRSFPT